MSIGYGWEGIRQVCATLLGARHVPAMSACVVAVSTWGAITHTNKCSIFYFDAAAPPELQLYDQHHARYTPPTPTRRNYRVESRRRRRCRLGFTLPQSGVHTVTFRTSVLCPTRHITDKLERYGSCTAAPDTTGNYSAIDRSIYYSQRLQAATGRQ